MRRLSLNLLTLSATVLLLVGLALPAVSERRRLERPPSLAVPPTRAFGVYTDPWHIDEWAASVRAQPTIAATFEAFSRKRTLTHFTAEAERRGIRSLLVSWEPWKPVPIRLGLYRAAYPQPGYRNVDIANGSQDAYIRRFARQLATFDGTVYLRFAHEMNGFWYPWSWDARDYRRAWRRIVRIVRAAGATNVRFVWSVNPSLYEAERPWLRNLELYWPGGAYVDYVGSTMINFGGTKRYAVARFEPRLRTLRRLYGKPIALTEVNTAYGGRLRWLRDLRLMLRRMPWVKAVVWSELPSRGATQQRSAGDMHWDVQVDAASASVLRGIIEDGFLRSRHLRLARDPAPSLARRARARPRRRPPTAPGSARADRPRRRPAAGRDLERVAAPPRLARARPSRRNTQPPATAGPPPPRTAEPALPSTAGPPPSPAPVTVAPPGGGDVSQEWVAALLDQIAEHGLGSLDENEIAALILLGYP
jgi:mannan endo-1,4-beta-mannosidase